MNTEKLKEILVEKNIEQQTLAEAVGVTQAFISYVIKGYKTPSIAVMKRIADFLGITVDELI